VEMKSGWISGSAGTSNPDLQWFVSGTSHWAVNWNAGDWHNVAYEIDFTANTVAFWHSTGSDPLTLTVPAVSTSASSNGEDWHLGVLELPVSGQADTTEDFYFSGVYVESGSLTTTVAGPGGVVVSSVGGAAPTTSAPSAPGTTLSTSKAPAAPTSSAPATPSAPATGTLPKYSQCGGIGWSGSGACVAGSTCTFSNAYYSQCL